MSEPTDAAPATSAAGWALALALLTWDGSQRVALRCLATAPADWFTFSQVWAMLDCNTERTKTTLAGLRRVGLVEQECQDITYVYRLTPLGAEAARRLGEG